MTQPTIILVNDTDHLSYRHASIVFGILNSFDIPFTHASFYTLDTSDDFPDHPNSLAKHCYPAETASFTDENGKKYISLLNHQITLGNEIAYHGYSQISNTRDKFIKGVSKINSALSKEMSTYIEHGGNPKYHPIEGCKKETFDILGKDADSEYFVKDVVLDNFKQAWSYFDLVSPQNKVEKEELIRSTSDETFYEKDGITMMKRYRAKDVATLANSNALKNNSVVIAYTHFGYCGYPQGTLLESWYTYQDIHKNCQYLNSLRAAGYNLTTIREFLGN